MAPTTDEPIYLYGGVASDEILWWLPERGNAFSIAEVVSGDQCVYTTTAHTWTPGGESSLTIGGRAYQVQVYSTENENLHHCTDGYADGGAVQASAYYDLVSGLLLQSEYAQTATNGVCPSTWLDSCDFNVGKTEIANFEAVELDLNE